MTIEQFQDLYRHLCWADRTVWQAILGSEACSVDERILDTMHHIHATQHSFLDAWRGREFEFYRREGASADELHRFASAFHDEVFSYLSSVADDDLDGTLTVPWTKYFEKQLGRSAGHVTLRESIYQVVSHSMHHRAQVATRIRELGVEPPMIDYIIWLWMERPGFDQDSVT